MYVYYQIYHCLFNLNIAETHILMTCISSVQLISKEWKTTNQTCRNTNPNRSGHLPCASHRIKLTKTEQEMCASQHTPVYINRVFPLPLGNCVWERSNTQNYSYRAETNLLSKIIFLATVILTFALMTQE